MTVKALIAGAAFSLALAPVALAGPAGDEYLPKVPSAGGSGTAHSASGGSGETTLPQGSKKGSQDTTNGNGNGKGKKKDDAAKLGVPVGGSGSGGGGDSSGSILLNPIVLLMIAAVIAAAVGMTLRRRQLGDGEGEPEPQTNPGAPGARGPRTPDGEIITGRDKAA